MTNRAVVHVRKALGDFRTLFSGILARSHVYIERPEAEYRDTGFLGSRCIQTFRW